MDILFFLFFVRIFFQQKSQHICFPKKQNPVEVHQLDAARRLHLHLLIIVRAIYRNLSNPPVGKKPQKVVFKVRGILPKMAFI